MGSAPKSTSQPQVVDPSTPEQRALQSQRATFFSGEMNKPDFGYEDISSAFAPIRRREEDEYAQRVTGVGGDRGFSPQGMGLQVSEISKGLGRMSEIETGRQAEERERYRKWVLSAGSQAAQPTQRVAQRTEQRGASPWASGLGYAGGAALGSAF